MYSVEMLEMVHAKSKKLDSILGKTKEQINELRTHGNKVTNTWKTYRNNNIGN